MGGFPFHFAIMTELVKYLDIFIPYIIAGFI